MCKPTFAEKRVLAAETFFRNGRAARVSSETEVKFDTPVNFSEVKILSPTMYLSTSTGGLLIGDTDPSRISLQFFCNNVHRPDATSLIDLGTIEYEENRRTTFACHTNIWSDKLVVSGQFYSLSIGVYGLPQDASAQNLQRPDRAINLPNLLPPGSIPAVMAFPRDYLHLEDSLVIDRFECTDTTDSEEQEQSNSSDRGDESDVNVTSDRSQSNSDVDDEESGEEEEDSQDEGEGEEEEEEGEEEEDDDGENSNMEEDDDGNSSTMEEDDDDDGDESDIRGDGDDGDDQVVLNGNGHIGVNGDNEDDEENVNVLT